MSQKAHRAGTERETDRIEAFSDGVFAFAITLLVLDIRIPSSTRSLSDALLHLWPSYFAYVLSFVMIGIYWANHHYVFKLYAKTNHAFNLLNLLFLLFIALLPLPTLTLSDYLLDPNNRTMAAAMYSSGLLLQAATWSLMWLYASWGGRLLDPHLEAGFVRTLTYQYLGSVALYAIALGVCIVNATAGLAVCVGLTLLYLLPPKKPVYVEG
ncbi:MAG: DUF1211 domain-containing protein [Candidatus Eremiobacteraeota bacterium]|nr:DUF1211 domain-containing protein [Candidatus Eremiobacteraeota bacterium]MBV8435591.1 DUF1211 domain-containing protein [Candidatus Eremiobacteraeota bacterium]